MILQLSIIGLNMNDIGINKRYKENPFIDQLVIQTSTKKIAVNVLGKGNNILVNQDTGEIQGTQVTTYKKVDSHEFVKLFVNNIALTFELHSYGIKAFNVVMWAIQYSGINKDLIVLDSYTLENFLSKNNLKMSIPTFRRGLSDLVKAKIIAKSIRKGWYFINPNFIFNGDRIFFTTIIERDKEENIKLQI
jgi:hypothetical protein